MFVSHFTKWEWVKIYFTFYYLVYWKYIIARKRKVLMLVTFLVSLFLLFFISKQIMYYYLFFVSAIPIISPSLFMVVYCPDTLVCFYIKPQIEEMKLYDGIYTSNEDSKYKLSFNYNRNVMDSNYDILFETRNYFFIYRNYMKSLVPEPSIILVINKIENQEYLGRDSQEFLNILIPRCKKYIKAP